MTRAESEPGVLLVDKPEGPTSHDVVAAARRALGTRRVGHTGTLDPFASGLLVLCSGRATRLVSLFHLLPKRYEAGIVLGVETDTDDWTGEPSGPPGAWETVTRADACRALEGLTGELMQTPPAFSAKKVDGRRAHRVARSGQELDLSPVPVRVHRLELLAWDPPLARVEAWVSTGTYVRALARDLGRMLACGAHLGTLRRSAIGPFGVEEALPAEDLREPREARGGTGWRTPVAALNWLPVRTLTAEEALTVSHGGAVPLEDVASPLRSGFPVGEEPVLPVALVEGGRLVAVAERSGSVLQPRVVLRAA